MKRMLITSLLFAITFFVVSCGSSETEESSGDSSSNDSAEQEQALREAQRELSVALEEAEAARQEAEDDQQVAEDSSIEEEESTDLSPTETLEVQWQFLNAGQYEESYNLFAEQSQQLISLENYSTSYSPTYEISDYEFFSESIQGDTATVEAELFLTGTQKGSQQFPVTQELALEDGEWRVVMRDAQAQTLLEKQESSTEQAEQSPQSANSGEDSSSGVVVRVTGSGAFSGNYGTLDSSRTVDGVAPTEYQVDVDTGFLSMDSVSAVMQKNGSDSSELGVQIVVDGEVVKETSTTAEYGVAQVNWAPSE